MGSKQHIEHRGIMLHIHAKSIRVEGCARVLYFRHPVDGNDIEAVRGVIDASIAHLQRHIQIKQAELNVLTT